MKTVAYLVLLLAAGLPQTSVQVDVIPPADSRITVERIAPYTIVLTNNTTRAITGLAPARPPACPRGPRAAA